MSGTLFDPAAEAYDRVRPAYPAELYAALERMSGIPLRGARVVEAGAGTGLATQQLVARGARVVAVDRSAAMLAWLRRRVPGTPAVIGAGEALPIRAGYADLVCYATAWHWVEFTSGVAAALRVLRPGGALALWWNRLDEEQPHDVARVAWLARAGVYDAALAWRRNEYGELAERLRGTGAFRSVGVALGTWERRLPVEDYLLELSTHSMVIRLDPAAREEFLAAQRAVVEDVFPDGVVRQRYHWNLHVARR